MLNRTICHWLIDACSKLISLIFTYRINWAWVWRYDRLSWRMNDFFHSSQYSVSFHDVCTWMYFSILVLKIFGSPFLLTDLFLWYDRLIFFYWLEKRLQEVQRLHFEQQIDELQRRLIETEEKNQYLMRTIDQMSQMATKAVVSRSSPDAGPVLLPDPK